MQHACMSPLPLARIIHACIYPLAPSRMHAYICWPLPTGPITRTQRCNQIICVCGSSGWGGVASPPPSGFSGPSLLSFHPFTLATWLVFRSCELQTCSPKHLCRLRPSFCWSHLPCTGCKAGSPRCLMHGPLGWVSLFFFM